MAQIGLANFTVSLTPTIIGGPNATPGKGASINITGWSDDNDALTMPDEFEIMNTRFGAGGELAAFRTGLRGGDVTIKLLPTSPTVKSLMIRLTEVHRGVMMEWTGKIRDTVNNFSYDLTDGVMKSGPLGMTLGSGDAANRMFVFSFASIVPDWDTAKGAYDGATGIGPATNGNGNG